MDELYNRCHLNSLISLVVSSSAWLLPPIIPIVAAKSLHQLL